MRDNIEKQFNLNLLKINMAGLFMKNKDNIFKQIILKSLDTVSLNDIRCGLQKAYYMCSVLDQRLDIMINTFGHSSFVLDVNRLSGENNSILKRIDNSIGNYLVWKNNTIILDETLEGVFSEDAVKFSFANWLLNMSSETFRYSIIITAFYAWFLVNTAEDNRHRLTFSTTDITEQNLMEEMNIFVELLKRYFNWVDDIYNVSCYNTKWQNALTPLDYDCINRRKFNLLVSLGSADWFTHHNPIVCASNITDTHNPRYQKRKYGWCYSIDSLDSVIGMCPEDFSSGLPIKQTRWSKDAIYATLDDVYYFHNTLNFRSGHADVLRFYPPVRLIELSRKKNTYNEILLDSSQVKPNGVFIVCENLDNFEDSGEFKHASTIAYWYQLPLVVYGELENSINIITNPRKCMYQ